MTADEVVRLGNRLMEANRQLVHASKFGDGNTDCGNRGRYRCSYHEGWEDAIDALITEAAVLSSDDRTEP